MILLKQPHNDRYIISGIIDISDCIYGPYLFELAIAMTHFMMNRNNPVDYIRPFLSGYLEAFPMSKSSLDIIYYVILGRLAQIYINGQYGL